MSQSEEYKPSGSDFMALVQHVQAEAEEAKRTHKCPRCKKDLSLVCEEDFRDLLSRKEYKLSGLCQHCQDIVFAPLDEEDE